MIEINKVGYNLTSSRLFIDRPTGAGDYLLLYFVGAVDMLIGGKMTTIQPFSLILFDPDCPQYYQNTDTGFASCYLHFAGPELDGFISGLGIPLNKPLDVVDEFTIRDIIVELEMEFRFKEFHYHDSISAKITAFMIQIARWCQHRHAYRQNPSRTESQALLRNARNKILLDYQKDWQLDEMAILANLSRSRFCALYQEFFKVSPKMDLINERLKISHYLLNSSRSSVKEIASHVGYDNLYHFSKQFKKFYGFPPSKARTTLAALD